MTAKSTKTDQETYSKKEADRRFKQALLGARLADPKPLKDVSPKRPAKAKKKPAKKRA